MLQLSLFFISPLHVLSYDESNGTYTEDTITFVYLSYLCLLTVLLVSTTNLLSPNSCKLFPATTFPVVKLNFMTTNSKRR